MLQATRYVADATKFHNEGFAEAHIPKKIDFDIKLTAKFII